MAKYLDLFTDFGFKKIFGEEANKAILVDFLNSLLPERARIKDLAFKNSEKLGITPDDRKAVYDIYCENERGEKFIVELQKIKQKYYLDRTIFYSTYLISEDAQKNEWNWILKPVYCISILDFKLVDYDADGIEDDNEVVEWLTLKNRKGRERYHKLNYVYIQMPNFNRKEEELHTRLDKWLYFVKNLEDFTSIPDIFKNDVVFEQAIEKAELAKMSGAEWAEYNLSLKRYRDEIANIETAKEEGEARGEAKGEAKGIEIGERKKAMEIAKSCLAKRMPIPDIAELTGLTEDEIKSI